MSVWIISCEFAPLCPYLGVSVCLCVGGIERDWDKLVYDSV